MPEGKIPAGERYVQLNIMDMFRNRRSGESSSSHTSSQNSGNPGRGEPSSSSGGGGAIRSHRHNSSPRHSSGSGSGHRSHRDRDRDRDRDRERDSRRGPYQGRRHRLDESVEIEEDSSEITDVEMIDTPIFYQGTSRMLRAAGGRRERLYNLNKKNAKVVVDECYKISRAVFTESAKGYLYNAIDVKPLGQPYCPGYRLPAGDPDAGKVGCRVRVVNQDTLVCAEDMVKRHNFEQSQMEIARKQGNTEPDLYHPDNGIVILNLANADNKGGGFLRGSIAQEEAIMHRSTLWHTLPKDFYPLSATEGIYSPFVAIYKKLAAGDPADAEDPGVYENLERAQAIIDAIKAEKVVKDANNAQLPGPPLPEIGVITIAALQNPGTKTAANGDQVYSNDNERNLMALKIRQTLRIAGLNGHRRLVLGALGCGVFGNPKKAVAELFLSILREPEFRGGWWKEVTFACYDPGAPVGCNFEVFGKVLDGQVV